MQRRISPDLFVWRLFSAALLCALTLAAPAIFVSLGTTAQLPSIEQTVSAQRGTPSIKTDKGSYLAGDMITISGSGFIPLESVMIQVKHVDGTLEGGRGHDAFWVYPAADGTFQATWSIDTHETAGTQFVVTANSSTREIAEATFTRIASISLNPFGGGSAEITAAGFNPEELIAIQVGGAAPQTVRADDTGRASLAVSFTAPQRGTVTLAAKSFDSDLVAFVVVPGDFNSNGWFSVIDTAQGQGAPGDATCPTGCQDDTPLQNDMTRFGRNDLDATRSKIFLSWNSVTSWSGVGQTGNACALFDSDGDGKINFVVCAAVENNRTTPTILQQVAGSPYAFACSDAKTDRCTQPSPVTLNSGNVLSGPFGNTSAAGTGDLVTATDPFPTLPGDLDHVNKDTTIELDILKSILPTGAVLVNVCSYPSAGNGGNNNPFDCVIRQAAGFLQITKVAPTGSTQVFTFDAKQGTTTLPGSPATITGSGSLANPFVVDIASNYSVVERTIASWQLDSKSCTVQNNGATGSPIAANAGPPAIFGGVGSIDVRSGLITTCTFTDSQTRPQLTLKKTVVNDNGGSAQASNFTLNASGGSAFTGTVTNDSGTTLQGSTAKQGVDPGTYTLAEVSPTGYTLTSLTCNGGKVLGGAGNNQLTLTFGDDITCTFVNNDVQPKLTLLKVVVNDNGRTSQASAFTLNAGGPSSFNGTVTNDAGNVLHGSTAKQGVNAGVYTLSESGPSGYTASAWSCPTKTLGGAQANQLTLLVGDDITCTITNNDNPGAVVILTVQKVTLLDTVTLVGYNDPGAANRGTVDFRLYSNNTCTTEVAATPPTANLAITVDGTGKAATSVGVTITPGTAATYYWKVTFSGDSFNSAKTGACDEQTTVSAINN